ncbi:hypothetical protein KCP71_06385 [Salmonella enterica subsp. enterica]|nr:hypothetical protein KCP71_06385 [Salmonella enterica subsp. enterica]
MFIGIRIRGSAWVNHELFIAAGRALKHAGLAGGPLIMALIFGAASAASVSLYWFMPWRSTRALRELGIVFVFWRSLG